MVVASGSISLLLSGLPLLGLRDIEVSSHMLDPVIVDSLLHIFLSAELNEGEPLGPSRTAVHQQIAAHNRSDAVEELLDVLFAGVV